jgi:predicted nucleic acid-binding protein
LIYIDTNAIISYVDELDSNHGKARMLVESLGGDRIVSRLTLVELVSVNSRAGLEEPVPLAVYSVDSVKARMFDVNFNYVLEATVRKAHTLKLKTLDLPHVITRKASGCLHAMRVYC